MRLDLGSFSGGSKEFVSAQSSKGSNISTSKIRKTSHYLGRKPPFHFSFSPLHHHRRTNVRGGTCWRWNGRRSQRGIHSKISFGSSIPSPSVLSWASLRQERRTDVRGSTCWRRNGGRSQRGIHSKISFWGPIPSSPFSCSSCSSVLHLYPVS